MLSLQRRHSQWKMLSILLFLGLICNGDFMFVRVPEETTTTSSSTVDVQNAYQSGPDSASLVRRTQKDPTVFIARELTDCAKGYGADKRKCMKNIRLNAYKNFLQKLLKIKSNNPQTSELGKLIYFFN